MFSVAVMPLKAIHLLEMIERSATYHSDKTALIWYSEDQQQEMSYGEFWQRVQEFTLGLEEIGIRQQSKVALFSHNNPCWLISDLAILSLGAVTIPIDPYLPTRHAVELMNRFDVEYIIAETAEQIDHYKQIPTYKNRFIAMFDEERLSKNIYSFTSILDAGAELQEARQSTNIPLLRSTDLATIVHTPGTNHRPKGIMLTHQNLQYSVESLAHMIPASEHDTFVPLLPLSNIVERVINYYYPLTKGATIVCVEKKESIVDQLQQSKPTILLSVPHILSRLQVEMEEQFLQASWVKKKVYHWALQVGSEREEYLRKGFNWPLPLKIKERYEQADNLVFSKLRELIGDRLRFFICAGGRLPKEQQEYFSYCGLPLIHCYHMTECTSIIACQSLTQIDPHSVGCAPPDTKTRLLTDGELVIKSPSVMMGYYKAPEKTTEALINGWLQSGDLVSIDEQDRIQFQPQPRLMMMLSTGQTFSPEELETAIETSPYIHQAMIIGHMHQSTNLLIVPDLDKIQAYGEEEKFPSSQLKDLLRSQLIKNLIQREISKSCEHLPVAIHPTAFHFLDRPFSIEAGTLTIVRKKRRWLIEDNFYREFEQRQQTSASIQQVE